MPSHSSSHPSQPPHDRGPRGRVLSLAGGRRGRPAAPRSWGKSGDRISPGLLRAWKGSGLLGYELAPSADVNIHLRKITKNPNMG